MFNLQVLECSHIAHEIPRRCGAAWTGTGTAKNAKDKWGCLDPAQPVYNAHDGVDDIPFCAEGTIVGVEDSPWGYRLLVWWETELSLRKLPATIVYFQFSNYKQNERKL